jgi:hypothetical protein
MVFHERAERPAALAASMVARRDHGSGGAKLSAARASIGRTSMKISQLPTCLLVEAI